MQPILIRSVSSLPRGLSRLVAASEVEGFAFLARLAREWDDGTNRFDGPGEVLLVATLAGSLRGIGGLSRDPFVADPRLGRVRHLYVDPRSRRHGVGRALMEQLHALAAPRFTRLRLRTTTLTADLFYRSLGYVRLMEDPAATHVLELTARPRAGQARG